MASIDSVFRTRSLGVAAEGVADQYADGKAAKVWELYIGGKQARSKIYRSWFVDYLKAHGVKTVLDVACGTGVDSVMLLEEGFTVVSCDASDKMLKYALEERWERRKEEEFDRWIINEANWLTLQDDLEGFDGIPNDGFDAVVCLGNSFAHLPDFNGNLSAQRTAIAQFSSMLKPGGLLLIDHRNYDAMLESGKAPTGRNVYYPSQHIIDIKCSNLYVNGQPQMTTLDYTMDITAMMRERDLKLLPQLSTEEQEALKTSKFRLSYYPHRRHKFTELLLNEFGKDADHRVYGDFKELSKEYTPAYFIHAITKSSNDAEQLNGEN